jgi:CRISPR/Cas system CMR subunit Cmr4 (Cas7 group RAMP superfamily)
LEEVLVQVKPRTDLFGPKGLLGRLLALIPPADRGFGYTRQIFLDRLLVVTDRDFQELAETGTEVVTRIKLNLHGTTATLERDQHPDLPADASDEELKGNLFVEELVPPETLFACALREAAGSTDLLDPVPALVRIGGDETIGRGLTHVMLVRSAGKGR